MSTAPRTLFEKVWQQHVVVEPAGEPTILYIDLQLLHEVTSPQAFEGLRLTHRQPWRTIRNLAVADHNVPTTDRNLGIADPISRLQVQTLENNCAEFGITEFDMSDIRQGIVHVVGPEQGAMILLRGDECLHGKHLSNNCLRASEPDNGH